MYKKHKVFPSNQSCNLCKQIFIPDREAFVGLLDDAFDLFLRLRGIKLFALQMSGKCNKKKVMFFVFEQSKSKCLTIVLHN